MSTIPIKPTAQGKVRDLYDLGDTLLLVASDRISAFDCILPDEIPHKGEVLTQISVFWCDLLKDIIPNHIVSTSVDDLPDEFQPYADQLRGRIMIARKADMLPVECIVRGYLSGSGWREYQESQTVGGNEVPAGLLESAQLPHTLFTPSTKAAVGDHDENITFEQLVDRIGEDDATTLRDLSIALYDRAAAYACERGIIIADTKFEFGRVDGDIVLADEVLTPDSSRFWPADVYRPGGSQPSFDKQYVRDWLDAHWDRTGTPPHLPADVISATTNKYISAYELITGHEFQAEGGNR